MLTKFTLQGVVSSPYLKSLICDVAFLTEKASHGDVVVYIGNNIGPWLVTVAKMFPTLHFLTYDGNPAKLAKLSNRLGPENIPQNLHIRQSWFNELEASKLVSQLSNPVYDPSKVLLMSDTNNMIWSSCGGSEEESGENSSRGASLAGPIQKHVVKDLNDQVLLIMFLAEHSFADT